MLHLPRAVGAVRLILLAASALIASPTGAIEPPALAVRALDAMDRYDQTEWSYTKSTSSKDGRRVERHDASQPDGDRWSLVTIDGRAPTSREIREYQREKKKESEERKKRANDRQEIDRSTLRLISETAESATFRFHPRTSRWIDESTARAVAGTLVVRKEDEWVERLELRVDEEIRPFPGVTVSEFELSLQFSRDAESGEIVPSTIQSRIRGRAFLVKSLDDDRTTHYSEFSRRR